MAARWTGPALIFPAVPIPVPAGFSPVPSPCRGRETIHPGDPVARLKYSVRSAMVALHLALHLVLSPAFPKSGPSPLPPPPAPPPAPPPILLTSVAVAVTSPRVVLRLAPSLPSAAASTSAAAAIAVRLVS
ncbi:hypothetical protein XA68_10405 [Ophiocordyceps unilateralis]|uniref:Uncharacterized protein n=1 Tax=Ophiocordyceps unilateralis TaxID=268505 RepID=A0A2A9PQP8_OPHUN|nr:hypothetical protein XA68_10405 [Ophiocordyceps unilateralis]